MLRRSVASGKPVHRASSTDRIPSWMSRYATVDFAAGPARPRPDETLIRALAWAHRWKRMLEEGRYRSAAEIAAAEGVTHSFVNRLLRLTLLAPDRPSHPRR
jgi:hypothetical protein